MPLNQVLEQRVLTVEISRPENAIRSTPKRWKNSPHFWPMPKLTTTCE